MNVWLCAEEAAGLRALRLVQRRAHRVRGVMTTSSREQDGVSIARVAARARIPVHDARLVRDPAFADELRRAEVDLLLNVHSLFVVDAALLAAPRIGAFNLHPGRLPEYAGLDSASWAIFEGSRSHAVTLHWMEPGVDSGAIAYVREWPSASDDTALAVNTRCAKEGLALIETLLADAEQGRVPRDPQDPGRRRYLRRAIPGGGRIAFDEPAERVVALVRACDFWPLASPFGHPRARLGARVLEIVKAATTGRSCDRPPGTTLVEDGRLLVACGDAWAEVKLLRVDGRFVDAAAIVPGGARLEAV